MSRRSDRTAGHRPRRARWLGVAAAGVLAPGAALAIDAPFGPMPPRPAPASEPDAADADAPASVVLAGEAEAPARSGGASAPSTASLPLGATRDRRSAGEGAETGSDDALGGDWGRTIGALALVIGLIMALRWGIRRFAVGAGGVASQIGPGGRAPSGLLTVLARYPVGRAQTLVLLQVDTRVLLLCQSSGGFRTLAEIGDPEEVASILVKARDESSESMVSRFRSLLRMSERDAGLVEGSTVDVAPSHDPRRPLVQAHGTMEEPAVGGGRSGDAVSSLRRRLQSLREVEA